MQGKVRRGLITSAVVTGVIAVAVAAGSGSAVAAPSPSATSAATWLEGQLTAGGGGLRNSGLVPGHPYDVGLTEDAVLALTAAGDGEDAATRAATATIAAQAKWFATVNISSVRLAGPLAKTLLVAEVQGADGHAFGGVDVEADLRAIMATSGADVGRFEDQGAGSDSSNGFSQALAVLALVRSSGGVPADAVGFLLAQQCPDGGFRQVYDPGATCTSNADDDPDSTGLAVQALSALPGSAAVTAAQAKAVAWLKGAQNATTGSFSGSGPTATVPNSNSTGLAAVALRLGGETSAADHAQTWVESLQLTSGKDSGAIGYDPAGKAAVTTGTIGSSDRDQWQRATAQALLALGVPGYGQIVAVPTAPTSSTSSSSSSSGSSSSTSSASSSTSASGHSTDPSSTASVLGEQVANSADPSDPGALAATGGVPTHLVLFALVLLAVGIIVTVAATDRTAKHR